MVSGFVIVVIMHLSPVGGRSHHATSGVNERCPCISSGIWQSRDVQKSLGEIDIRNEIASLELSAAS